MNTNLAKEIILKEAQFVKDSKNFDELEIDFMGGEPFMNFPLIKEIVEWLEGGVIDIPYVCFATTNGTLLTDEIKNWLRKHKNTFVAGASYDGNSEMQSTNRGTDKYNLDLDFFYELWSEQSMHMTISKETLPNLAEGIFDIHKKGYKFDGALANGVDWTIDDAIIYREQLCILKDFYLKNTALTPFNRLTRYINILDSSDTEKVQEKFCGAGKYMATYNIDGKKYGCHMFTPVVLGDRAILADSIDWDSPKSKADDYCKTCVLRNFCSTCQGSNCMYRGNIAARDKRWCPMVLAEALTACEFQIELISKMDKLDEKDAQHGKMALQAYRVLQYLDVEKSKSPYTI